MPEQSEIVFLYITIQPVQELKPTISQMVDLHIVHIIILYISSGTYPDNPKLTQKSRKKDKPQYPIPDNYIYVMQLSSWKENRTKWGVNSTKSSTAVFLEKINCKHSTKVSGPRLFGFDIEPLYI
ncbi:hypothetical protein GLOIN_2v1787272 [Rhizophagus irregularis DAOM 181602=DAOM 197198]|nr:hypothetical protein GLOIN_2v1787272 [Rhizophagus irregularis DAOM 181602=DAOM 197198]